MRTSECAMLEAGFRHVLEVVQGADLERALLALTPREEMAIRSRFGFRGVRLTFDEIGLRFGVSRERARQIVIKGLRKFAAHGIAGRLPEQH